MTTASHEAVMKLEEVRSLAVGHEGPVRAVRFNSDGNYCMTCGSDKTLRLSNPYKGTLLKTYIGHGYEVLDAVAANENDKIASCGTDKTVILWDVSTGKCIRKFKGHMGAINCVKANQPDFTVLVSGSYDATVRCWDTRSKSKEPIQILNDAKDSIPSVQISDHTILTGSVDGYLREYDLRLGKLTEDCMGESITSVSFTNDGQCLLASSLDSRIRLIDRYSGELLNSFKGHQSSTYKIDCCLSHDDKYVVSGSEDGSLFIWDLVESHVTKQFEKGHTSVAYSISVHPHELCILSAGSYNVKLWQADTD